LTPPINYFFALAKSTIIFNIKKLLINNKQTDIVKCKSFKEVYNE